MNNNVLFSIIVPIYNLEKKLERCLRSLQQQTYQNLQVMLIDDGSNDRSLEICKEFEKEDKRFKVLHHQNKGVSYTRNRGIECATGKYIMFVDGDDICLDDMVDQYVKAAEKKLCRYCYRGIESNRTRRELFDKDSRNKGRGSKKNLLGKLVQEREWNIWICTNKMYLLSIIKDNRIRFRENMTAQEDLSFALRSF